MRRWTIQTHWPNLTSAVGRLHTVRLDVIFYCLLKRKKTDETSGYYLTWIAAFGIQKQQQQTVKLNGCFYSAKAGINLL